MRSIWCESGARALRLIASRPACLVFDFDGTLAPLSQDRNRVRLAADMKARLVSLQRAFPIAVVSGRECNDLRSRLDWEPDALVGNHGAQWGSSHTGDARSQALAAWSASNADLFRKLAGLGIEVEDKGLSMALHYRQSPCPEAALQALGHVRASLPSKLAGSFGHAVLNIVDRSLPDKGDALLALCKEFRTQHGLYIGDDANDEPAFLKAPDGFLTVRIGWEHPSKARFHLASQSDLAMLLLQLDKALVSRHRSRPASPDR